MNDSEILDSKQNAGANAEEKASDPAKKSAARNYHVSTRKEDGKWQVKFAGGEKAIKLFDTQVEAIAYAKKRAKTRDGSTPTQKREEKMRKQGYGEQTPAVQWHGGAFEKTGNYTIKSSSWRKKREFTQICGKTELIGKAQAYFNRGRLYREGLCRKGRPLPASKSSENGSVRQTAAYKSTQKGTRRRSQQNRAENVSLFLRPMGPSRLTRARESVIVFALTIVN